MPAQNTADTVVPQSAELLRCFPCPAWIENSSGKILARNAHFTGSAAVLPAMECGVSTPPGTNTSKSASTPFQTSVYPLPFAGNAKNLRLVALFPATQETNSQHGVISALLAKILHPGQAAAGFLLTPREREIHRELSRGYSYKTIASNLGVSHETVRWHVARIRQKLGPKHIPILRQKNSASPQPKPT